MAFKQILVATDFSDCAKQALDLGVELAQKFDAQLMLVHAWEVPTYSYGAVLYFPGDLATPIEEAARAQLATATEQLKARLPRATSSLRAGVAWQEIISAADAEHADLIVVGTHGRRGINRALLGSVAERVVRLATVPVLTVHSAREAKAAQ